MKTFETEKHNIPEGATHYREETNRDSFAWVCFYPTPKLTIDGVSISGVDLAVSGENLNNLKPIPQTNIETPEEKEVEWVSGNIAMLYGDQVLVIAYHPNHPVVVVETNDNEYLNVGINDLSKPETPQQREDRERLEAAEDLYYAYMSHCNFKPDWEVLDETNRNAFLTMVDKTNYRKEKTHGTN